MSFLKKLFGTKEEPVVNNSAFWNWFILHEKSFYKIVKNDKDVDRNFLDKLMQKLEQLNPKYYCSTGMLNNDTAELVITADGDIKTFIFAEDLIEAAPVLQGWKFTALKPPTGIKNVNLEMSGYQFNSDSISFYSNEHSEYPDEIDITLVHTDLTPINKSDISNGCLLFLDYILGELNAATLIDSVHVAGDAPAGKDLIPFAKLNDFLSWREKEFVEKYKATRYNTENDSHSALEGEDEDGFPLVAVINQDLLDWEAKPSHPWIMVIEIKYDAKNNNGMPDTETFASIKRFNDECTQHLPDYDGYLNLGRQTYNGNTTIYFACKEFRNVSKTISELIYDYHNQLDISYDIFKDKYWTVMNRFNNYD